MKTFIVALLFMTGCATTPLTDQQAFSKIEGGIGEKKMALIRGELYMNPDMPIEELIALIGEDVMEELNSDKGLREWGDR